MPRKQKPKQPVESPRLPGTFETTALGSRFIPPPKWAALGSWTRESLDNAVQMQFRGVFRQPAALGREVLRDPSIFSASLNRLAPLHGLGRQVCGPMNATGKSALALEEARMNFETDTSTCLPPGVLDDAQHEVSFHALSVAQIQWEPRRDGSRVDPFVTNFDLDAIEWDETARKLFAWTKEDGRVEVVHGDGRWIVFARSSARPWQRGSLISLGELYAEMRFGRRDRANNAESHGDDKWLGELPPGIAIDSPDGKAMLNELEQLYQARRVMIRPNGSKVERNEALGQNWQIFKELIESGGKDAQRILLGQDGTMTNAGGNYIKSWVLYGVRNDIVESDLRTLGACLSTGLLRPWSIINFGKWDRLRYEWMLPDADEDARRESIAARRKSAWEDIEAAKRNGFEVDQAYVDQIFSDYGLKSPRLAAVPAENENVGPLLQPTPAASSITAPRKPLTAA